MRPQGNHERTPGARLGGFAAATVAALMLMAALAGAASAHETITSFSMTTSTTQAGGHPDLGMSFQLDSPGNPESAENVIVNTPEGIFGNPNAITRCTPVEFGLDECPPSSQAGYITVRANYEGNEEKLLGTAPIYDVEPEEGTTALFAFIVPTLNIPVNIPVSVRTGSDYGLRFKVSELTQLAPLASADIKFWGFPAAESNDGQRFPKGSPGSPAGCPGEAGTGCVTSHIPASITVHPLINNPVRCTGAEMTTELEVQTYQDPGNPTRRGATLPETTGCYDMTFKPVLYANPTTPEADAPSGLDLEMKAPQPLSQATTPSPIRSATMTLPQGFTINPDAADGQLACSEAEVNFGSAEPGHCPDTSKIGNFSVGTAALDGRLNGSIYIGEPKPGDEYRLFLIADGFGIHAKFLGHFYPNPQTGQVTASIAGLPQVPFDDFQLHLFASDRGLMATPGRCGVFEVEAHFLPWNDKLADQTSKQLFSISSGPNGSPCPGQPRPFAPSLVAGMSNPIAGGFSSFALQLDRNDGDQFLGDLNFTMPPGLTASLRGITYCPDAAIAAAAQKPGRAELAQPSCPASSEIGTTNVAAGPGSHPFHAIGSMYLAGPFKGAPLSLVAITPALAGPYDYGTQVVRVALNVDPLDAHVIAVSDTVPKIIGGIPLRMRSIRVSIDRPNFMINPTNCTPTTVHVEGVGDEGTVAGSDSYFRTVNCFGLPFKPHMTMRQLGGHKRTNRAANPPLRFDLYTRHGDANIKSVAVTLPKAFEIDQRHLGNICSRSELEASHCAGRQAIGTVETQTPLLDAPLKGPAYAVSGFGKLPHLAFILAGQVTIIPEAESSSVKGGHLKTVVPVVPDAPVGHFRLSLFGGKKGYIVNTRNLCKGKAVTKVEYTAQNGKQVTQNMVARTACGHGGHGGKHRR